MSVTRAAWRRGGVFYPACVALIAAAVALRWIGLPFQTHDMQDFLLPWFDYIVTHGRFAALSDNFYNYTPPYIYAMTLLSYLDGFVDRVALIKAISIAFDFAGAGLITLIVSAAGGDRRRAAIGGLLFLILPTPILNSAFWGQCDVIYTDFLLATAYMLIRGRPAAAMAMFGVALALKVQAIFAAPFIAYLLLVGVMPLWTALIPPAIYALLVLPAALAGRSWISLFMIYGEQAGIAHKLSARAPNIYVIIQHFLPQSLFGLATLAGIGFAGLASLAMLWVSWRRRVMMVPPITPVIVVATMALWLTLEPSILPKIHERYFFPADTFGFVLAVLLPRAWWVAALFQVGSMLAYAYFMLIDYTLPVDTHPAALLGALATMPAAIGLGCYWWSVSRPAVGAGPILGATAAAVVR